MSLSYQQSLDDVSHATLARYLAAHWRILAVKYIGPGEYTVLAHDRRYGDMPMYTIVEVSMNEGQHHAEPPRPWVPDTWNDWVPVD